MSRCGPKLCLVQAQSWTQIDAGESDVELFDLELMALNYLKKEDRRKKNKKSLDLTNFDMLRYFGLNFLHNCPIRANDPNSESLFRRARRGKPATPV